MHKGGVPEREGVAGGVPELERVAVAVGVPELERVAVAVGVGDSEEEGVLKMEGVEVAVVGHETEMTFAEPAAPALVAAPPFTYVTAPFVTGKPALTYEEPPPPPAGWRAQPQLPPPPP
jgi:hypothetical protein